MRIPNRRKRLFVSRLQYRFLGFQLAYVVFFALVFLTFAFAPLVADLTTRGTPQLEKAFAAQQFLALHRRVWPAILIAVGLFTLHSTLVSHRVAGPLVRFRNTLERLGHGDLTMRVVLRRHDYLVPEAKVLNAAIERLREPVREMTAQWHSVQDEIEQLKRIAPSSTGPFFERIDAAMGRLGGAIAYFKTDAPAERQEEEKAADPAAEGVPAARA